MYYKSIAINKVLFDKILGQNGNIQIYDQNGNRVAGIDKNTPVDANGNMVITINQNVTALRIETTKPETEGIITFNISKAIKATTNLSRATITNIQRIDTAVSGNIVSADMVTEMATKTETTNLKETAEKHLDELTQEDLKEFARFGNAVASLCVEKKGAIPAMPELAQEERRIAKGSYS